MVWCWWYKILCAGAADKTGKTKVTGRQKSFEMCCISADSSVMYVVFMLGWKSEGGVGG